MQPLPKSRGTRKLRLLVVQQDRRLQLPKDVRAALGVEAGDSVVFHIEEGAVYVRKARKPGKSG